MLDKILSLQFQPPEQKEILYWETEVTRVTLCRTLNARNLLMIEFYNTGQVTCKSAFQF